MSDRELLIALFALLERENAVSIPQTAALLGASEDEVWAALEQLAFAYDLVELRMELGSAHATLQRSEASQVLRLSAVETQVLLDALAASGFGSESPLVRKLLAAKGFLAGGPGSADPAESADPADSAAPAPGASPQPPAVRTHVVSAPVRGAFMELLTQACEERIRVRVEYQKEGAAVAERRTIEPQSLRTHEGFSYLEAYDIGIEGWRTFRVDRILNAAATGERFERRVRPDADADVDASSGAPRAKLLLAPGVDMAEWARYGRITRRADGTASIELPWYGTSWLPKRIAAGLGDVQVLSPPELARAAARYAHELLRF